LINLERGAVAAKEARAIDFIKSLSHPNVVGIREVLSAAGYLVVCMELGQGTLRDRLRAYRDQGLPGIPGPELVAAMGQAAAGIDYLNAPRHVINGSPGRRVVHQGIKPQNLLLVSGVR